MGWIPQHIPLTKNNNVSLHEAIYSSYHPKEGKDILSKKGYIYDDKLSNHNESVYYNPNEKKLLYNIAGTHNLKDWGTDSYLALGKLKDTNRYKEADRILKQAQEKYKVGKDNTSITGHSLGATIGQYLHNKGSVKTLDAGYTIGQKTRGDAYRSKGDIVSLLGSNAKHTTTLNQGNIISRNKNTILGSKFGLVGALLGKSKDILNAHNIDNIKNEKIYV